MKLFLNFFMVVCACLIFSAISLIAKPSSTGVPGTVDLKDDQQWTGFDEGSWLKQVNLTSDQKQKIDEIRKNAQPQIKAKTEELALEKRNLRDLMMNPASNDVDIRNQFNKVQDVRRNVSELYFNVMLGIRSVLTPEQRSKLAQHVPKKFNKERLENCKDDIDKFCPGKEPEKALFHCLKQNESKLSAKCKEKLN